MTVKLKLNEPAELKVRSYLSWMAHDVLLLLLLLLENSKSH